MAGANLGVEIADGSTPSTGTPGSSTVGTLPNPTSNSYLNKASGTLSGLDNVNVVVDLAGITFANPTAVYSYQIGQGFSDQSLLSITDPSRFTFLNPGSNVPVGASLTGNAIGDIFLSFQPIPEPTMLLGLTGLALVAVCRRRKV